MTFGVLARRPATALAAVFAMACALVPMLAMAAPPPATVAVKAVQVAPHSWYVEGMRGVPSKLNQGYSSNAGFVVTRAGVIVFDALGTPPLGEALLKAIRSVTRQPVRRVIVSHYHADHFYGLQAFKRLGAEIWADRSVEAYLQSDAPRARMAERKNSLAPWVDDTLQIVAPDRYLDRDEAFEFGGLNFTVSRVGPAHTAEDLTLSVREDGVMFAGETARGWGAVGPAQQGLERLEWTGKVPFEIKEVRAQPDGFVLTFTEPVDPIAAAKPENYNISGFTYLYHRAYGSAPVNRVACPIRKVVVAPDGLSVRLAGACLREGYVHEIKATGLRAAKSGEPLLHATAYYTLNRFPDGNRIIPLEPNEAELCVAPVPAAATVATAKHPSRLPGTWTNADGDRTILLGTLPGMKFDTPLLTVAAGSNVRLVFRNSDDMLHNFVLCAPGRGEAVGAAALALGLEGPAKSYVPESADVLYHTALIQPEASDTIFFTAPTAPGDYEFICSFPGHAATMKGILRVEAR